MLTRRQSSSKLQVQTDSVTQCLNREESQHPVSLTSSHNPLSLISNQIARTGLHPLESNEQNQNSTSSIGIQHKAQYNVKQVSVGVRDYSLNKLNMLNEKLNGCAKEHINIEMKANKNLVLKFSTAAYEYAKASIEDFLESDIFQSEFAFTEEQSLDDKGVNVETRFKVVNRKADGKPGKKTKLTINCYHTNSCMLINGSKVDFFCEGGAVVA